ncbi:hypothetical protein CHUAL_005924 [Chamberlinius hualienensis]
MSYKIVQLLFIIGIFTLSRGQPNDGLEDLKPSNFNFKNKNEDNIDSGKEISILDQNDKDLNNSTHIWWTELIKNFEQNDLKKVNLSRINLENWKDLSQIDFDSLLSRKKRVFGALKLGTLIGAKVIGKNLIENVTRTFENILSGPADQFEEISYQIDKFNHGSLLDLITFANKTAGELIATPISELNIPPFTNIAATLPALNSMSLNDIMRIPIIGKFFPGLQHINNVMGMSDISPVDVYNFKAEVLKLMKEFPTQPKEVAAKVWDRIKLAFLAGEFNVARLLRKFKKFKFKKYGGRTHDFGIRWFFGTTTSCPQFP